VPDRRNQRKGKKGGAERLESDQATGDNSAWTVRETREIGDGTKRAIQVFLRPLDGSETLREAPEMLMDPSRWSLSGWPPLGPLEPLLEDTWAASGVEGGSDPSAASLAFP
jgi:hypothetical protein